MSKPSALIITTAWHINYRYRLHNFIPYFKKYFDIVIIDLPLISFDKSEKETLMRFALRVLKEITTNTILYEETRDRTRIYTIRSRLPLNYGRLANIPVFIRLLQKYIKRCDVVIASPFLAGVFAEISRRILGDITVVYEDADRFSGFYSNIIAETLTRNLEYTLIEKSDIVIAVSPHLYLEDKSLRKGPTYLVPNGIQFKMIRKIAGKTNKRNRKWIVYVGAVDYWSGLDIALKAFKKALRTIPDLKLHVIGDWRTKYGLNLVKQIRREKLTNNVFLWGPRPYNFVLDFLSRSSIGIITFPRTEVTVKAFPYKVLEYGAAGLPIIMTNTTFLSYIVKEFNAGLVFEENDIDGLSSAIIELVENQILWRELSANAVKMASLFDVERMAEKESRIILSHIR